MLVLLLALLSQTDPNAIYQGMSRADKQRIFLVWEQEIIRRQNSDKAVAATEAATGAPGGAVRLVVLEMKRDADLAKARKDEARGLTGKNAKKADKNSTSPPKTRTSRRSGSGGGSSSRSNRTSVAVTKKKYSGEGIKKVEGEEKVNFDGKDREISSFVRLCRFIPPDKVELTAEKAAIVIDGVVKQSTKHWTLVERSGVDGTEYSPVVVMHEPSTASAKALRKGDRVRLWGWIADESQTKAAEDATKEEDESKSVTSTEDEEEEEEKEEEDPRPAGLVFFAMDVDKATREFDGLEVTCQVADISVEGSDDLEWELTVEAKNKGTRPLADLEVEANLVLDEVKSKDARDSTFVYFDRVDPGKTSTVKVRIPNWVEEEVEISGYARTLSGKYTER